MRKNINNNRGFTLIELMIAMSVGIIILLAVFKIYATFLKTSTAMDSSIEAQLEVKAGGQRLVKELRGAGCYYTGAPVHIAISTEIEFESDIDPDPSKGPWLIKYKYDALTKTLQRAEAAWSSGAYGPYTAFQVIAGHVTAAVFRYYDATGIEILSPVASQANRDLIRKVTVNMTATPDNVNPSTGRYDTTSIQTGIQMRCMGVQQSTDVTECVLPTGITVSDPSSCGRLNLTWIKSTSTDAAGYRVFYRKTGLTAYTGVFDVPGGATQAVTITGLQDGVQYDIAMKCFDTAGNINALYAGPVTGLAIPTDTRPDDITAPLAPTGIDATAADGSVNLSWTAGTSVDTGGYNIYRSDDGGVTYAKVGSVDSTVTQYSDISLANCPAVPFYYKVSAWDCAANELPLASQAAVVGDATLVGGIVDIPVDGVTSTYPKDTTPPADPTGFVAVAGADKVYLSYTSSPGNFLGTRILRRTDIYPINENDTGAIGPNGTMDYQPQSSNQTYTLIDSTSVIIGTTYYYRSFAYDSCMNYSAGILSTATAKPCGDGIVGSKHFGPPLAPTTIKSSTCDFVSLDWKASTGSENGNTFIPLSESDVVGYNVYRGTTNGGPYPDKLNSTPVTSTTYSDASVTTGVTYYYAVKTLDCADKESTTFSPQTVVAPNNIAWDPSVIVTTSGTPDIEGSGHNVVTLAIHALGNSSMTIDSAIITWNVAPAFLKKVTLKPDGVGSNVLWNDTVLPLSATGTSIDFASYEPTASLRRINAGSTGNILELDFRNFADSAFVDLSGATISFTITYTSDADEALCTTASFSVPVTRGATILQTTQNKPVEPTTANLTPGVVSVLAGVQDPLTYVWTFDTVTVSSNITPESGTTVTDTKLYYQVTPTTTTTAPATDYSAAPTGWTALPMCQAGTSTIYQNMTSGVCTSSAIPMAIGERVWYYLRAVDSRTNVTIEPDPAVGIYSYDQQDKFNIALITVRSTLLPGGDITVYAELFDRNFVGVIGADVTVFVTNLTTGLVVQAAMQDIGGGTYQYPAGVATATGYSGAVIDVKVDASKGSFTLSKCADMGILSITPFSFKLCY